MIATHDNQVITADGNCFVNTEVLAIYVKERYFPFSSSAGIGSIGRFIMSFSQATTVGIDWGNGTTQTFNTVLNDGVHSFTIAREKFSPGGRAPLSAFYVSEGIDYGTEANRIVRIIYNKNLLTSIGCYSQVLPVQDFVFSFAEHRNLISFNFDNIRTAEGTNRFIEGAFRNIDLRNLDPSALVLNNFSMLSSSADGELIDTVIPVTLFDFPLKTLRISGKHESKTFTASNLDMIGEELADTLENLELRIRLSDTKGIGETPIDAGYPNTGGVPGNLAKLTNLKEFRVTNMTSNFLWTEFPPVLKLMNWLESIDFNNSRLTNINTVFTIASDFFTLFSGLKFLNLNPLAGNINNYAFIANLPATMQNLNLSGIPDQTRLDTAIMTVFTWVKAKSMSNVVLGFGNGTGRGASSPTGTYQEPIDHANPATAKEAIWVLSNDYDCTVTYVE